MSQEERPQQRRQGPVASVEFVLIKRKGDARIEWMRLYLRGRMTDGCGTQSTQKGMGLVKAKCEFLRKIIHHHGDSAAVCAVGGCFKSWKGL